jgi:heptosyltransferase-2
VPNWIGDSVMALPALRALRDRRPGVRVVALAKRRFAPLWEMVGDVDGAIAYDDGLRGLLRAAGELRAGGFEEALIFPNSFRSALLPWLAGIPRRRGRGGRCRRALLTEVVPDDPALAGAHQAREYMGLPAPGAGSEAPPRPRLRVPEAAAARAAQSLRELPRPRVAVMPGAARGPSKRWPADRFAAVAARLAAERGCGICVLGSSAERGICAGVAAAVRGAADLSGSTGLADWVALLAACDLALCNDSGGMHLAAAVGTPLVAIFGATDPAKTGPLTDACRIVQGGGPRSRDVARRSAEAARSLAAVSAEEVYRAAAELLGDRGGRRP